MRDIEHIAILGGSGSGKTKLSLEVATLFDCAILSLDSLSVFREIDIASAKPSKEERGDIVHFGFDIISPANSHNVHTFIDEYNKAVSFCRDNNKKLLIVGGSSFYLKTLLSGLSEIPKLDKDYIQEKLDSIGDIAERYMFLDSVDSEYAKNLKPSDTYRIDRALSIYFATNTKPSVYFAKNPPKPIIKQCKIFEILLSRDELLKKIQIRTQDMFDRGIIDEVRYLVDKYGETKQWIKSIGIKESLSYIKGGISLKEAQELIVTHTMQLTKRQRTFNKTQLESHLKGNYDEICSSVIEHLKMC